MSIKKRVETETGVREPEYNDFMKGINRNNNNQRARIEEFALQNKDIWGSQISRCKHCWREKDLTGYKKQFIHSFGYDFVIPCRDERMIALLKHRTVMEPIKYASNTADIFNRIHELGGITLYWY